MAGTFVSFIRTYSNPAKQKRSNMKSAIFAALAASTILMAGGASPAAAHDFPYCLQGPSWGYPGNCQFETFRQCLTTASGTDSGCGINPRAAFAAQRPPRRGY